MSAWKVLEICELCALSTDSQKTYSVNALVALVTAFTTGGEGSCWGENNGKDPSTVGIVPSYVLFFGSGESIIFRCNE